MPSFEENSLNKGRSQAVKTGTGIDDAEMRPVKAVGKDCKSGSPVIRFKIGKAERIEVD